MENGTNLHQFPSYSIGFEKLIANAAQLKETKSFIVNTIYKQLHYQMSFDLVYLSATNQKPDLKTFIEAGKMMKKLGFEDELQQVTQTAIDNLNEIYPDLLYNFIHVLKMNNLLSGNQIIKTRIFIEDCSISKDDKVITVIWCKYENRDNQELPYYTSVFTGEDFLQFVKNTYGNRYFTDTEQNGEHIQKEHYTSDAMLWSTLIQENFTNLVKEYIESGQEIINL